MNEQMRQRVYRVVQHIPAGHVMTYGAVAKAAAIKNPRLVGLYLHVNPDPAHIPCHRVVNATGMCSASYAFGGKKEQEKKLRKEGVQIRNHHVDLHVCGVFIVSGTTS